MITDILENKQLDSVRGDNNMFEANCDKSMEILTPVWGNPGKAKCPHNNCQQIMKVTMCMCV